MKLYIQNMVCLRCKMMVKLKPDEIGIKYKTVELGEVDLVDKITSEKLNEFKECLLTLGLVLIEDQKAILVKKIKSLVIDMIHHSIELPAVKYSVYISEKLHHNYTYLANLFF